LTDCVRISNGVKPDGPSGLTPPAQRLALKQGILAATAKIYAEGPVFGPVTLKIRKKTANPP
jgi:hypothetical protein